ncbi:MAG: septal ring lytic transglycosylase RlpA family protein [Deltaproteobacteria bacterium]|nr:septal ring lytic transglycosylase RlpA family protein [Deltaproteobacteria bacterium]
MTGNLRHQLFLTALGLFLGACSLIRLPYDVTKGTVEGTLWAVKTTYWVSERTTKTVYKIGEFTYEVARAPIEWSLTNGSIETIDGLPPKDAIRLDRVKTAPYAVNGTTYYPMSVEEARRYAEVGIASWYSYETSSPKAGYMTASGEAFDPNGLTAAHKRLPLPTYARVTNLENGASIIVRVNDRGPFPRSNDRTASPPLIELSRGAAQRLGFYGKGTARVKVEALEVEEK